jgi:hypothetical protein
LVELQIPPSGTTTITPTQVHPAAQPDDWAALVAYDPAQRSRRLHAGQAELYADCRTRIPGFSETNLFDALKDTLDRLEEVDGKKGCFSSVLALPPSAHHIRHHVETRTAPTSIYRIGMMQFLRIPGRPWLSGA